MGRYSYSDRGTCGSRKSIDIRLLAPWLTEAQGRYIPWNWSCDGRPTGTAYIFPEWQAIRIVWRSGRSDQGVAQERVHLSWTDCHFGGRRPWFSCPRCHAGAALIYTTGSRFLCRRCCRLNYASQQEDAQGRQARIISNVRRQLGGTENLLDPYPAKPRGMHRRTYESLVSKAIAAEAVYERLMGQKFSRWSAARHYAKRAP
jgi:hypothetical protein